MCNEVGSPEVSLEEKKSFKEVLEEASKTFQEIISETQKENDKIWEEMPYEQRLAAADFIFRQISDHAAEGGSYRYLIYNRLGFGPDAYAVLQCAGALDVSNDYVIGGPIPKITLVSSEEDSKCQK